MSSRCNARIFIPKRFLEIVYICVLYSINYYFIIISVFSNWVVFFTWILTFYSVLQYKHILFRLYVNIVKVRNEIFFSFGYTRANLQLWSRRNPHKIIVGWNQSCRSLLAPGNSLILLKSSWTCASGCKSGPAVWRFRTDAVSLVRGAFGSNSRVHTAPLFFSASLCSDRSALISDWWPRLIEVSLSC